jgi:hypothetical protein
MLVGFDEAAFQSDMESSFMHRYTMCTPRIPQSSTPSPSLSTTSSKFSSSRKPILRFRLARRTPVFSSVGPTAFFRSFSFCSSSRAMRSSLPEPAGGLPGPAGIERLGLSSMPMFDIGMIIGVTERPRESLR